VTDPELADTLLAEGVDNALTLFFAD